MQKQNILTSSDLYLNTCVIILNSESKNTLVDFFSFNGLFSLTCKGNTPKEFYKSVDYAQGTQIDYIATIDASQGYDPNQLFSMLSLMYDYDLVVGSRFLPFSKYTDTWFQKVILKLANLSLSLNTYHLDWFSSLRLYRTELLQSLRQFQYTENYQVELLGRANQLGAKIFEYPVSYQENDPKIKLSLKTWWNVINYPKSAEISETELG